MTGSDPAAGAAPLALVILSDTYERVHFALAMAAAALACDRPVILFFTMGGIRALTRADKSGRPGWAALLPPTAAPDTAGHDADLRRRGVAGLDELLSSCLMLGARIMVCEMGLRAQGLDWAALRPDVTVDPGGLVTFLAGARGETLVI